MKKMLLLLIVILLLPAPALSGSAEQVVPEFRRVTTKFAADLKGHLKAALLGKGPVQAIAVCSDIAPEIARRFSDKSGWDVGRTALKYRNPENAPDAWEQQVLYQFEKRRRAGESPEQMECYEAVNIEGRPHVRYMKAIETKPVCLNCHGTSIDPAVEEAVSQQYPKDRARGFEVGDIRGAFTIVAPMEKHAE